MLKHLLLFPALLCTILVFANNGPDKPSIKNFLNPDGSLKSGARGNFDATGYRMRYSDNGMPLFSPAGPGDNYWEDGFGYGGINGTIYAITVSGTETYVGGSFTDAGGVPAADYVAKWDGTQWSALGQGTDMYVHAIAVIGTDVYVGGQFNNAKNADGSNVAGTANIARWDGTQWNAMGYGMENDVLALAVSGTSLYVGGNFGAALSAPGTYVPSTNTGAIWNGTSWSSMHNINIDGEINAITISGTKVYVGGSFNDAGGVAAADWLACWTGSAWTALGTSVNSSVYAIAVSGSMVYVGGYFSAAGGVANTKRIARWNGSAWSAMGGGISDINMPAVRAIAIIGSDVFVGGTFQYVKSNATTDVNYTAGIARWNGSAWSAMQRGVYGAVYALTVNTNLIAAGTFTAADASGYSLSNALNLAKWTGSAWQSTGMISPNMYGLNSEVNAISVSGSDIYVGGSFTDAGGIAGADYIAKWNGSGWSALGTGTNGMVRSIAINGSDIYIGGDFNLAGGVSANGVARWNGSVWSGLGTGGSGINTLAFKDGILYAGGYFTYIGGIAANYIAKWNGSAWSAMGSGTSGYVFALAVSGTDLIIGGQFTSAGGVAVQNIARWNGTAYSPIGTANSGVGGIVRAIAVSGTDIHVGGEFSSVSNNGAGFTSNFYSKWNGSGWEKFNDGQGYVYSIAVLNEKIYLGTNNSSGKSLSMYNGTDLLLPGTGVNSYSVVYALAVSGNKVYAGGSFNGTYDRSKAFSRFGIFNEQRPSVITSPAANISYNSADLGGEITNDGGLSITERGVVWSANNIKPDTTSNRIIMGTGNGIFNQNTSPLPANNTIVVRAYAKNDAGFVYGIPVNFNTPVVSGPEITSFSPQSGITGSTVSITGQNFNTIPSGNIVYFGATRAQVVNATATSLEVTVPACASYQSISVLNKDLPAAAWSHKPFLVTFTSPGVISSSSFASSVDFTLPSNPYGSNTGDIDNDGKTDIIVNTATQVLVYRNTSTTGIIDANSFAPPVVIATGTYSQLGLVVNDLDGDGLKDIALGSGNYKVILLRNNSTIGNIVFNTPAELQANSNIISMLAADLNNDGKAELVYQYNYMYCYYGCTYYGYFHIFTNTSVPGKLDKESFAPYRQVFSVYNMSALKAGDLDNDGKIDLAGRVNNMVYIFRNTTPQFSNTNYSFDAGTLNASTTITNLELADLDGDNKLDVLTEPLKVFRNIHTSGSITSSSFEPYVDFGTLGYMGLNDIDGDGRPDVGMGSTTGLRVHKNLSDPGAFTTASLETAVDINTGSNLNSVFITDIDGNSRPELVATQWAGPPLLRIFQNVTLNALPLTLVNFNGRLEGKDGLLNWTTSNEFNTRDFEIERSTDGLTFTTAGTSPASGNSTTERNYSFTDLNITDLHSNVIYYRLKMNDADGNFSYSGIIALRIDQAAARISLYPNPVVNAAMVSINATRNGHITMRVSDLAGKTHLSKNVKVSAGMNNITLEALHLPAGVYTVKLSGDLNERLRFVKK